MMYRHMAQRSHRVEAFTLYCEIIQSKLALYFLF